MTDKIDSISRYRIVAVNETGSIYYVIEKRRRFLWWDYWDNVNDYYYCNYRSFEDAKKDYDELVLDPVKSTCSKLVVYPSRENNNP